MILSGIGTSGYGIWTLARTITLYAAIAGQGAEPAIQRYISAERAANRLDDVNAAMWTTVLAYSGVGLFLGGLMFALTPTLIHVFSISPAQADDAKALFHLTALSLPVGMAAAALGNVLQGLQRFETVMRIDITAAALLVLGVGYFTLLSPSLAGLGVAVLAQQTATLLVRAFALRKVGSGPALLPRQEIRHLVSFSAKLQISTMGLLISTQTDKLVLGLITGPAVVAEVAIGAQIAESLRVLQNSALTPITTHLSSAWAQGQEAAARLAARVIPLWRMALWAVTLMMTACIPAIVLGWVGPGHSDAALYGATLVLAYSIYMLPGASFAFLRAQQRPRIEIGLALQILVLNLILSIAGGLAFAAPGVVGATLASNVIGVAWASTRTHRDWIWPNQPKRPRIGQMLAIIPIAALTGAASWLLAQALPQGIGLIAVGIILLTGSLVAATTAGLLQRSQLLAGSARLRAPWLRRSEGETP